MTATQAELASPTSPSVSTAWDSELFVLRADGPAHLAERARELVERINEDLPSLAYSLASELKPGGSRLAIVATSPADLRKKLTRAAERLDDPKTPFIRDAAGVYYFAEPLYVPGSLALLFPGEGAQYLNMLADLCEVFPEVEETFGWAERIADEAGRPHHSLRRMLHLPADASAEERASAEVELRKLGASIFGVLLADQAISKIIDGLQIPVSAIAGHSAGELGALLAAGAMSPDAVLGSRLADLMDLMQSQEDAAGNDVALIAVGAGASEVRELAANVAGGSVVVAMDNCPHQCVAVGPTHLVANVEMALAERGRICERLPFRRPYHTPMFEPWMGPFRELFAGVPFMTGHTRVYSCSTGEPFPTDPDAIRELAVNHWVSPVEFTRLIERMHGDGIRLFVECGPRGNLSAFVEDVLRGQPMSAIPANTQRRSGPTQINHLVAQLVAHGVPVNLDYLYANRFELSAPEPLVVEQVWQLPETGSAPTEVMTAYLNTMDQFLDVQEAVHLAYFAGEVREADFLTSQASRRVTPQTETSSSPAGSPEGLTPPGSPSVFALVHEITHFVPGQEIIFRRPLDLCEDRFADDHTLGGRGVSRVDPKQNGLPVLPMTFSLEAMAEAASLLVPGKVVIAVKNVRLYRWIPFDPEPTMLEARASVATIDPETGLVEVKADVRDLGNSFLRDATNKVASEATVVLADEYPEPPIPHAFRLTDEVPCKSTAADLRRNMFHGPTFQMIRTLGRIGREGIEGTLEVQDRCTWFASNPEPNVVVDPVLTDAAMHLLGAWHLEQPDWTGRILLPFEVQSVEYFGPAPAVGSECLVRGHNEQESARHFRHGLEVFTPDGHVWLRLTGAGYWRFYLPFGHVNFFGPKDEYFLSRDWPEAVPEAKAAFPRCHYLDPPVDLKQPVLRAAGARVTMSARELIEFQNWTGTDAELNDWFFGRLLAKDAVRASWNQKHGEATFPADMEVERTADGRYVVTPRGEPKSEPFPPVAVAILDGKVAAFSAFAERVGIALEPIGKNESEGPIRERAARRAMANALGVAEDSLPANVDGLAVQTARDKDVVIATALGGPR